MGVKDPGLIPEPLGLLLERGIASSLKSDGCGGCDSGSGGDGGSDGGGGAAAFFFTDAAATFVGHPTGVF